MSKYNKYQKALDILESACLPRATYDNLMPYGYGNEIELLQELVDKATSKPVIPLKLGGYKCPFCESKFVTSVANKNTTKYCPECGQRLGDSDE